MDAQTDATHQDAIQRFLAYPFDTDETYQQGLAGILSGSQFLDLATEAKEDLLLRSRVFYFNRLTGSSVDVDEVRRHPQGAQDIARSVAGPTESVVDSSIADLEEPRTLSFAELKELIEQGKTDQIPNNRIIPETLSEEAPSASTAPVRKKPWEA